LLSVGPAVAAAALVMAAAALVVAAAAALAAVVAVVALVTVPVLRGPPDIEETHFDPFLLIVPDDPSAVAGRRGCRGWVNQC
jgi:hypothetical protein